MTSKPPIENCPFCAETGVLCSTAGPETADMVGWIAHGHDTNGDTDAAEMLRAQAAKIARLRAQLRCNQEADRRVNRDHDLAGVKATLEALRSTMNDG